MADGSTGPKKKKSAPRKRDSVLIRAVRVEVVRPECGRSWDELGTDLRSLRFVASRAINTAVTVCELARVGSWDVAPETAAYRAILWELASFRVWASESKDEQTRRYAAVEPASGTLAAWEQYAFLMWKRWLKEGRRSSLPSAKHGAPILVRRQEWEFKAGDRAVLNVKLVGGRGPRHEILVKAGHGSSWEKLRRMQRGELAARDMKLVYSERNDKWFAILSYEEPPPPTRSGKHVLVVHRGCRNFLTFLRDDGRHSSESGTKVLSFKRQMRARTRSLQTSLSRGELGDGARGHGRRRRHLSIDVLHAKEEAFLKTHVQQTAARAVELAKQWDCGEIVWEDYGGIPPNEDRSIRRFVERYPLFKLGQALEWVCKREGFKATQVPSFYISAKCPACEIVDVASHNQRTGVFHCTVCGFERLVDWVAAFWMLQSAKPDNEAKRKLAAARKLEERLKGEKDG